MSDDSRRKALLKRLWDLVERNGIEAHQRRCRVLGIEDPFPSERWISEGFGVELNVLEKRS